MTTAVLRRTLEPICVLRKTETVTSRIGREIAKTKAFNMETKFLEFEILGSEQDALMRILDIIHADLPVRNIRE